MTDALVLYREACDILDDCGIPYRTPRDVRTNRRLKRALGRCRKKVARYDETLSYYFEIEIREDLLKSDNKNALLEVMCHELVHTVEGCFNHGSKFKKCARIIANKYPNIHVTRCTELEKFGIAEEEKEANYILECQGCGKLFHRQRMSNLVKYPHLYHCAECNGSIKRLK